MDDLTCQLDGCTEPARRVYCSDKCKARAKYLRGKESGRVAEKNARRWAKELEERREAIKYPRKGPCTIDGCEQPIHAVGACKAHKYLTRPCKYIVCLMPIDQNGMCKFHYRRSTRHCANQCGAPAPYKRLLCEPCRVTLRRFSKQHNKDLRRASSLGIEAERVLRLNVYARDNWTCGICTEGIDQELTYPHPMSVSLDHIKPLSRGGEHTESNAQASHLVCNMRKGAKVSELVG